MATTDPERADAPSSSNRLTLRLFGAPHISWRGEPLQTDTRKAIALLVYLAMKPGDHPRDELASLLWTQPEPTRNKAALRRTLSTLRKALDGGEDVLQITRKTIALAADQAQVDACTFSALLDAPPGQTPEEDALQAAIELYQGPFLDGFYLQESTPFEGWCAETSLLLQNTMKGALLDAMDHAQRRAAWPDVIALAQRSLQLDAFDEVVHQHLIASYIANGQRADALEQYEHCRRALSEGLGVKPSPETRALLQQIQRPESTDSADSLGSISSAESPEEATAQSPSASAQAPTAPLFGRDEDLEKLLAQLAQPHCHWLTLTGPVGCGKSHLARHIAALPASCPTTYIDAATLLQPQSADALFARLEAAAEALATSPQSPQEPERKGRLIVDHLPQALCHDQRWRQLGTRWPSIQRMLVTRQPASVREESVYELGELPHSNAPDQWADSPVAALLLWVGKQLHQDADFQRDDAGRAAMTALVALLGGHPLALQMAAGWLRVLSLPDLVEELTEDLGILEQPWPDEKGEKAKWKALFQEVWQALPDTAQQVCRAMAQEAAEPWMQTSAWLGLPGASLPLLLTLREQGWLCRDADERVGLWRIMASSIRQWA